MDAIADQTVISVSVAVADYLRRLPTRAEIHAARRAAHGLAASGQATVLRVKPHHAPGSSNLLLARQGMSKHSKLLEQFAGDATRIQNPELFDPRAIALDLATSVDCWPPLSRPFRQTSSTTQPRTGSSHPSTRRYRIFAVFGVT